MFLTTNELSGDLLRLFSVKWIHRRLFVPLLPRTPGLFGMFSLDREILSYPSERSELRYNNPVQKVRCFFHISSQGFGFSSSKGCPVYSARSETPGLFSLLQDCLGLDRKPTRVRDRASFC